VLALLLVGAGAALGVAAWLHYWPPPTPAPESDPFALPPYAETRFQNVGPDAQYIGSAACAACHKENHASYLLTAHSQALSDIDPKLEPPNGSFEQPATGRTYRVYRKDDQLRQEELLRTAEGKEVARVDLPVRYLIGSGHFSRSYLVEIDGFLHESPITWYTAKKKWGLSPGYDMPVHASFERPVGLDCLSCHAGRAETIDGSVHRVNFHEKAIGCENCHGPGSLHQEFHRTHKLDPGADDPTIVHPGKLPRDLEEAICATCHLSGPATIPLRGRKLDDFRPGRPLTDYRMPYRFESGIEQMTVVGHVEQLHLSACYQKSADLTCVTCHNPHQRELPKDKTAFYREKCLNCHESHPCTLDQAARLKKAATDNCVACHMPRGDTDIPHIAFTHHRIGRHTAQPSAVAGPDAALVAAYDESRLSPLDRRRNLGLAYWEAAYNPLYAAYAMPFRERAREELEAVHRAKLPDANTALALADLSWTTNPALGRDYAREALATRDASPKVRDLALTVCVYCDMQEGDFPSAVDSLNKLVKMHRFADNWRLLGVCYLQMHRPPKEAVAALQKALEIRPFRHTIHAALAEAYRRQGDAAHADEHLEKASWLMEHRQD
jgi:tetratricopeptide (TPR) repeat protein